jgi:hypothetical protein
MAVAQVPDPDLQQQQVSPYLMKVIGCIMHYAASQHRLLARSNAGSPELMV